MPLQRLHAVSDDSQHRRDSSIAPTGTGPEKRRANADLAEPTVGAVPGTVAGEERHVESGGRAPPAHGATIIGRPAFPQRVPVRLELPPEDPEPLAEDEGELDDPYEPIVEADSGGVIHILAPGSGRRIRPREAVRVNPEEMTLAPTTTNLVNVAALEEDHPELRPLLALTHDIHAFEALFLNTDPDDKRRPLSRGMSKHHDDLVKYDIIEDDPALTGTLGLLVIVWCTLFIVPKKIKTIGRLVLDARPVNRRQKRPPPMGLPRIGAFIRHVLHWEVGAKCDGKSFFYQFPVVPAIGRYFRVRLAGRRGSVLNAILKRLPMGWSFSPAIAQAVGNALTRGLGLAWVDDFVIGGERADFEGIRSEFVRRLRRYNIEVDDETLSASTTLYALGLEFDLLQKRYRLDPAWVSKREARWAELHIKIKENTASFREVFELYGALIWADYVSEQPLWMRAECLAALSHLAKKTEGDYDRTVFFPRYALANLDSWIADVKQNPWRQPLDRPESAEEAHQILFSDASSTGGAWIRIFKGQVTEGAQWNDHSDLHIYLRELEAMCEAARNCPASEGEKSLHVVDNTAVVGTANKGHSSSYAANAAMRETFGPRKPWTIWAPTDRQLADPYTRGVSLPPFPTPATAEQLKVIASLDAQGLPDSKRNIA